jgi:uncharacterized membrane protein
MTSHNPPPTAAKPAKKAWRPQHPMRTLATGLLALLPLLATVLLLVWLTRFAAQYVGPGSAVGRFLGDLGLGGTQSETLSYALGLACVVVFVYAVGLLAEVGLQHGFNKLLNAVVQRIPVVRTIYDVLQKLVGLFSQQDDDKLKSMAPVWVYFGGKKEGTTTATLAFLSTAEPVQINGHPYMGVIVPTAPVPIGGGLLFVPPTWLEPAAMGLEGVSSIYVSMGVTTQEVLTQAGQVAQTNATK